MLPSTKLTLGVLVLPITVLILSDVVIFHYYKTIEVSASIATIAVLLLVWERLRDSLSKKLEYLHKNYLLRLYIELRRTIFDFNPIIVKRTRPDLERYGKFMGISLYPTDLLKKIDDFLISYEEFDNSLFRITEIGKEYCDKSLDRYLWLHLLEIKRLREADLQRYSSKQIQLKLYADQARKVRKEQAELIEETQNLLNEAEKMRKEIFEKLEDFFKSNNLRLEVESRPML